MHLIQQVCLRLFIEFENEIYVSSSASSCPQASDNETKHSNFSWRCASSYDTSDAAIDFIASQGAQVPSTQGDESSEA